MAGELDAVVGPVCIILVFPLAAEQFDAAQHFFTWAADELQGKVRATTKGVIRLAVPVVDLERRVKSDRAERFAPAMLVVYAVAKLGEVFESRSERVNNRTGRTIIVVSAGAFSVADIKHQVVLFVPRQR